MRNEDQLTSGALSQNNTFDDVMLGVFINGGSDFTVTDNVFRNVDHCFCANSCPYNRMPFVSGSIIIKTEE